MFVPLGWKPVEVRSNLHEAARIRRLPWLYRLFALFPPPKKVRPGQPWAETCLQEQV